MTDSKTTFIHETNHLYCQDGELYIGYGKDNWPPFTFAGIDCFDVACGHSLAHVESLNFELPLRARHVLL